jgi:TonB-linked SusC/RagA family outer membrane protein
MARMQSCARSLFGLLVATMLVVAGSSPGAAQATGTIGGKVVEATTGRALPGVQITLLGLQRTIVSNSTGDFAFTAVPAGEHRISVQSIGYATAEQSVRVTAGQMVRAEVRLTEAVISMDALVVTSLGQTAKQRSLGTAQQTVTGATIAGAQKENFINALQGRVAGLEVYSSSGVPGASSQIIIRGVSSISGNNSPLMIIDGLPVDNRVMHSNQMFPSQFENRGVDFTNRSSDFNPEDIETLTVLKGPEAAALYGIDAANGAIVITTKRGKAGVGRFDYSNSLKVDIPGRVPETQHVYGPSSQGSSTFLFYGNPYPDGATLYNNTDGYFRNAMTQKHNLSFSGASDDSKINYRVSASTVQQEGVIPTGEYNRFNVTASSQAVATSWLHTDAVVQFSSDNNLQPFKGANGPLLGLLAWPDTVDATDWITEEGKRKRITTLSQASEIDNPYFSTYRNRNNGKTNRVNINVGFTFLPVSWGNLKSNIGVDNFSSKYQLVRDPESVLGFSSGGTLDENNTLTRNISSQTLLNLNRKAITSDIGISGMLGNAIRDERSDGAGATGNRFLDPTFISMNNTFTRSAISRITQRRLVSAFGQAQVDYKDYLFVTATGRNDWTSTIPSGANSFFYPGVNTSFVFSDAFPAVRKFVTGKVTAAWAEVGKDARPYAYAPSLENKLTSYSGYGYGFTGPNPNLRPEFKTSYEFGTELGFLDGRLGLNAAVYRAETRDQIVDNVRASYASGFILINLNGARTRSEGLELTLNARPIRGRDLAWDIQANFTKSKSTVLALPDELPEYYSSDTWLVGNVRNGVSKGVSTMALTGYWYLRNKDGEILIDPTTGLPIKDTNFVDNGYDRQPDFLVGLSNNVRWKRFSLSALLDIRKGGDVYNATEWWLTQRGLSTRTLDRETPRVVKGVLRDGKENTATPTKNSIVVIPSVNTNFYLGMSEELFIEKDINWLRLRDVTVTYNLPDGIIGTRSMAVFLTGTELFLLTNYSGADPVVNGNTAATGGSGGIGIDFGNFPMPRGINFGVRVGF